MAVTLGLARMARLVVATTDWRRRDASVSIGHRFNERRDAPLIDTPLTGADELFLGREQAPKRPIIGKQAAARLLTHEDAPEDSRFATNPARHWMYAALWNLIKPIDTDQSALLMVNESIIKRARLVEHQEPLY